MKAIASACERAVDGGIALLVLFTPLAFGSVEGWAVVALESSILAIGALWLAGKCARTVVRARRLRRRTTRRRTEESSTGEDLGLSFLSPESPQDEDGAGRFQIGAEPPREEESSTGTGMTIPILFFVGICLLQLVPLPRSVLALLSPHASTLYERTVPGYGRGANQSFESWLLEVDAARSGTASSPAERKTVSLPISYMPDETRAKLLMFGAYALLFFVAADRYTDSVRRSRMIVWIAFVGVGVAIQGIVQKLTWNGKILWFRDPGFVPRSFGPFLNANHFAGYMELVVPLALGLLLTLIWRGVDTGRRLRSAGAHLPGRERESSTQRERGKPTVTDILPWTATNPVPKAVLLGFLLALSIGSIMLSLSRGGFLATLLTFAVFSRLLVPANLTKRTRVGMLVGSLALAALMLSVGLWLGASAIAERAMTLGDVSSDPSYQGRLDTWVRTLEMIRDHAVLGTGLGSFEFSFAGYYPAGTYLTWKEAHNDYLQFVAEAGLAGLGAALLALYVFMRRHYLPAVLDRQRPDRYLLLGLAMAILSMLLHSFVDFNLQVPAVGVLFVLIGALITASSHDKGAHLDADDSWRPWRRPSVKAAAAVALLVASIATAVIGARNVHAAHVGWMLLTSTERSPELVELVKRLSRNDPQILSSFADSALSSFDDWWAFGNREKAKAKEELSRAETAYRELIAMRPLWSWGWWGLGNVYARRSALQRADAPTTIDTLVVSSEKEFSEEAKLAAAALRTSLLLEPDSYLIMDDLARLYRDEGLHPAALETYRASARIMPLYDKHRFRPPEDLPSDVYRAIAEGMEQALSEPGLVDPSEVRQRLGEMALNRGNLSDAEKQFRLGLTAARSAVMQGSLAYELGEVLRRMGRPDDAIPFLERGKACLPVAWRCWTSLGQIRSARGDHRVARDAFKAAVELEPGETWVRILEIREMIEIGEREDAVTQLRSIVGADPGAREAKDLLSRVLREMGRSTEAFESERAR